MYIKIVLMLVVLVSDGEAHVKSGSPYVMNIRGPMRSEFGLRALRRWKGTRDVTCAPLMFMFMLSDAFFTFQDGSYVRLEISDFIFGTPNANETHMSTLRTYIQQMISEFDVASYKVFYDADLELADRWQDLFNELKASAESKDVEVKLKKQTLKEKLKFVFPVQSLRIAAEHLVRSQMFSSLRMRKINYYALGATDLFAYRGFKFIKFWLKPFTKEFTAIFFGMQYRHKEVFLQVAGRFRVGNSTLLGCRAVLLKVKRRPHRYVHVYIIIPRIHYTHYTVARKMYSYPEAINNMTWHYRYINFTMPYMQMDHTFYDGRKPLHHFGMKPLYSDGADDLMNTFPMFLAQSIQHPVVIFGKSYITCHVDHVDLVTTDPMHYLVPEMSSYYVPSKRRFARHRRRRRDAVSDPDPDPYPSLRPGQNPYSNPKKNTDDVHSHTDDIGQRSIRSRLVYKRSRMRSKQPRYRGTKPSKQASIIGARRTNARKDHTEPPNTRDYRRSNNKDPNVWKHRWKEQWSVVCKVMCTTWNKCPDKCYGSVPKTTTPVTRKVYKMPPTWNRRKLKKCRGCRGGQQVKTATPKPTKLTITAFSYDTRSDIVPDMGGPLVQKTEECLEQEQNPNSNISIESADKAYAFVNYSAGVKHRRRYPEPYFGLKAKKITVNHPFIFLVTVNQELLFSGMYV